MIMKRVKSDSPMTASASSENLKVSVSHFLDISFMSNMYVISLTIEDAAPYCNHCLFIGICCCVSIRQRFHVTPGLKKFSSHTSYIICMKD